MLCANACGSAEERLRACAVIWSVPGARPSPRSIRLPCMFASVPYCSAAISGERFGNITPPEPTRIRSVTVAAWEISSAVELAARFGGGRCSANHNRPTPKRSARRADFLETWMASRAVDPSEMETRSRMLSGTDHARNFLRAVDDIEQTIASHEGNLRDRWFYSPPL